MIKKVLVVIFMVLMVSVIFAADNTPVGTANVTGTASPFYAGKFAIGYNGGLNFRFFPSEAWGFEIPLSGNVSSPYYTNVANSYRWSAVTGVNLLLPIKNNFETCIWFEPGIVLGSNELYSELQVPGDGDSYGAFNKMDQYLYTFYAGITFGLEAELFLNKIWDKLPRNISIGSKIALTGTWNLSESWDTNIYNNGFKRNYDYSKAIGCSFSMLSSTNALMFFTIRYYF